MANLFGDTILPYGKSFGFHEFRKEKWARSHPKAPDSGKTAEVGRSALPMMPKKATLPVVRNVPPPVPHPGC